LCDRRKHSKLRQTAEAGEVYIQEGHEILSKLREFQH
jgi:hypothetical protein